MKPEIECFEPGHIMHARSLLEAGLIEAPPMFQLCLGIQNAAPATTEVMTCMRNLLPEDANWAAFGISRWEFQMVAQAVNLGGHVRVGLEDNLYLSRGKFASNAQLVERAVGIVRDLGADVGGAGKGSGNSRAASKRANGCPLMKPIIVIAGAESADSVPGIEKLPDGVEVRYVTREEDVPGAAAGAEVVFGWGFSNAITKALWRAGESLRWLHWCGSGIDSLADEELFASEVILTNSRGTVSRADGGVHPRADCRVCKASARYLERPEAAPVGVPA